MIADDVRRNILQRTGNQWWADRLVPVLPGDFETVPRARMLQQSLLQQWDTNDPEAQASLYPTPPNPLPRFGPKY